MVAAAAAHVVTNLRVFGRMASGEDRSGSDLDLLADLPPGMGLLGRVGCGRIWGDLRRKVDLVPAQDRKPGVRPGAERELVAL